MCVCVCVLFQSYERLCRNKISRLDSEVSAMREARLS